MSGLALVAHELGARVSGSDRSDGPYLGRLAARGMGVTVGHHASSVPARAELVVSSAVPPDNVERIEGRRLGLVAKTRGSLLAELTGLQPCIAVAGTHGKTTTAAMTVHALRGAGIPTDYVIGGDILPGGGNAEWHGGRWLVVETDESDRSLLELSPEIAVVTNVELDHVEAYATLAAVEDVFARFLAGSALAVVWDRTDVVALSRGPTVTFDAPTPAVSPEGTAFTWRGRNARTVLPGEHNARNAAAALEAAVAAGADPDAAVSSLAGFRGVARRFELAGRSPSGSLVIDDYAHHPTEVAATLAAARSFDPVRLVAVLRPWGPDRVRAMAGGFAEALRLADIAVVLDVAGPAAGDDRGALAAQIAQAAHRDRAPSSVMTVTGVEEALELLGTELELRPGDVCVALGCGDVADRLVGQPVPAPPTQRRVPSAP